MHIKMNCAPRVICSKSKRVHTPFSNLMQLRYLTSRMAAVNLTKYRRQATHRCDETIGCDHLAAAAIRMPQSPCK